MQCDQLSNHVTDYLENALTGGERQRLETHVAGCESCHAFLEQMKLTIKTTGHIQDEDISPSVKDSLNTTFREWKKRKQT